MLKAAISMLSVTDLTNHCVCIETEANAALKSFKSREGKLYAV